MNKEAIINRMFEKFLDSKQIVLFGAGRRGKEVANIIKKDKLGEIAFFIDNSIALNNIDDIHIYKGEKLLNLDKQKYKIIICTDLIDIYEEIKNELVNLEYKENEDFISSKILRSELISNKDNPYEDYDIISTYAPWLSDMKFLNCFNKIRKNTLVDIYRCYELWTLVEQASKLKEGIFLEIGVWRGGTGTLIAKKAQLEGLKENVYLCDTFTGVVKATDKDQIYVGGEHSDTSQEYVKKLVDKLELKNIKILKGIFPDETGFEIDEKIRFCHIDVDVYKSAKDVVRFIWGNMINGGIIVFDDYGFKTCTGITTLINELKNDKDKIVVENLNGHAVIIKIG
ncbi:TylF/MycF/NovP-related O-methyltransferase [Romboutsia sedimentorum]|uniref:TylF/MycF/NovP-related O-methyltransferase n=1 Tax=Romboutsia sedimentorum TaxID=1368474 RepID=A0ABT7EB14_9FIRM|nr:TylF/MycF/NovP-related O-methyltransferase [Romboutsia sedimentorum]MDK2562690.1 TylF/MycF/NovP-related O-methyltransferase [Romboutsia sedimentorum]